MKLVKLAGFTLPWTRMAHACVWTSISFRPSAVLPSGQGEAVIYVFLFSLFKQKENLFIHMVLPLLRNLPRALTPRTVSRVWESDAQAGANRRAVRGGDGIYPSTPSSPPRSGVWPVSLWLFVARWAAAMTEDTFPSPTPTLSKRSVTYGLSLRRCCWRSWMWKPWPCWRCRTRLQTSGCEAWGRGHWPVGARRCGPPFGIQDSAL